MYSLFTQALKKDIIQYINDNIKDDANGDCYMEIVKSSMKRTDETKFTEVLNLFCWQYFIYDQNSNLSNEDYRFKEKICSRRVNCR